MSKGFCKLRVAEPFPIFLWQLSLAQVNVSSNLHWKLSEGTSHKDLSSERQRHKKVLSPISRLILWIMEADYERRKEHGSFPMKFFLQKFYFLVLETGLRKRKEAWLSSITSLPFVWPLYKLYRQKSDIWEGRSHQKIENTCMCSVIILPLEALVISFLYNDSKM